MTTMNREKFFNSKTTTVAFILYILITAFILTQSLLSGSDSAKQSDFISSIISSTVEYFTSDSVKLDENGKDNSLYPTSIAVSGVPSELILGKTYSLNYNLLPANTYPLADVTLSSSDESVVLVDLDGVVTPLKCGQATITVKDKFSGVKKVINVNVVDFEYSPELTFKALKGFSEDDNAVYYSTINNSSAMYSVDFEIDGEIKNVTATPSDEYDAVVFKNTVYFCPKQTGIINLTLKVNYLTSDGIKDKAFIYPITVIEKQLPTYSSDLQINTSDIQIKTDETAIIPIDYADFVNGLETAQKRFVYAFDNTAVSIEKSAQGFNLTPKKVSESTVFIYYVYNDELAVKTVDLKILQGVPKDAKLVATANWATNGKALDIKITGDGKVFNYIDFDFSVDEGASIRNGKFFSEKNGVYTVVATHKSIDGFMVSLTIEVKYSFVHYVRKVVGHFALFLLLAIFATVVYYRLAKIILPNKTLLLGTGLNLSAGLLTACLSEILQTGLFVAGRTPSYLDVAIDFAGFIIGFLIAYIIYIIYRKAKAKI